MNMKKEWIYKTIFWLATRIRDSLNDYDFVLLFAYNGTGKTRLSGEFKDRGKSTNTNEKTIKDTLYYNAFTEDLFTWENDLERDKERYLRINKNSDLIKGLWYDEKEAPIGRNINGMVRDHLQRYADFEIDFETDIDEETWKVSFSRGEKKNIKISRSEESIFIWCVFLMICELALDKDNGEYEWVKNIYVDDPVSSLDDNNIIAIGCDLARILTDQNNTPDIKFVISTHHALFFNVMYNELKRQKKKIYYLKSEQKEEFKKGKYTEYSLQNHGDSDTPLFYHVAMLAEIKEAINNNKVYDYHFNIMRSIMEKQTSFTGHNEIYNCLDGMKDKDIKQRALHLRSHGNHSLYNPEHIKGEEKDILEKIVDEFIEKYHFNKELIKSVTKKQETTKQKTKGKKKKQKKKR